MAWLYTQLEARGTTGQKARLAYAGIVVSWLLNLYKNRLLLFRLFILICAPICMALSRRLTTYSIVHSVRMKTGSCHSEYHAHVLYTLTCRQSWYAGRSNNSSPPGLHWRVSCGVMHGNYMAQYAPSNIALYLLSNSGCLRCRAADMDTCVRVCACVRLCVCNQRKGFERAKSPCFHFLSQTVTTVDRSLVGFSAAKMKHKLEGTRHRPLGSAWLPLKNLRRGLSWSTPTVVS